MLMEKVLIAQSQKQKGIGGRKINTLVEIDKSGFWRLDERDGKLFWSIEQGLLLCSVIFRTSIPSSPYYPVEIE